MKLDAKQLRALQEKPDLTKNKRFPVYFILENIYDTYNIGGLFRLADALNIQKVFLCGETATPPNNRILKASVGTYKIVPWEYCESSEIAIKKLRNSETAIDSIKTNIQKKHKAQTYVTFKVQTKIQIIAVEQNIKSVPYMKYKYSFPIAFIFGNETSGIKEKTLKICDSIVEIPMWGVNKSLNVIVSAAIVSYEAYNQIFFCNNWQNLKKKFD